MEQILKKFGVKYEDLNPSERETFNAMVEAVQKTQLSPEKMRDFITSLKNSVESELASEPEYVQLFIFKRRNDRNIYLKARLRNYMLIESFLQTPEKAKQALDKALAGMVGKQGVNI